MSEPAVTEDPELRAEQDYLDRAHRSLSAMRARAEGLLHDLRGAGQPDLDYQAALVHRVAVLGESARPLLFGRIDEAAGPSWHIGRRHVEDDLGDPVVVDWRAPVSMPFYRARVEEALGLQRRRQVMVDRRRVVAVADDLFGQVPGELSGTRLRGGDALLAELERARTGEMLDIVATIQAEQDEIIRAPLGAAAVRPGRAGHREDGGGTTPGRVPPLQPSGAGPRRRPRARAEPRLPALHRAGAAVVGGGGGGAVHGVRPGTAARRAGAGRPGGAPAQGRPAYGGAPRRRTPASPEPGPRRCGGAGPVGALCHAGGRGERSLHVHHGPAGAVQGRAPRPAVTR